MKQTVQKVIKILSIKCQSQTKEVKESKHFIRMLSKVFSTYIDEGRKLWKEAHELNLIFTTIIRKAKETEQNKNIISN